VVMGAVADHVGNITPVAEYNMWADPHAVDVVLRSGLQLEFVGWDISRQYTVIDSELAAELRAIGTKRAEFCIDINAVVAQFCATETKLTGFDLPGPFCGADMPAPDADFMAAVERDIAAQEQAQAAPVAAEPEPITEPISNPDEGVDMPRKKVEPELSRMARTLAARFPWLAELDARTNREFGPKPHRLDDTKGYNQWTQYRKSLMSKKQAAEFAAFYGPNRGKRGVTQDTPAAASKLEKSANGVEAKVEKLLTRAAHSNGTDLAHQRLGRALVKDPEVMQATIETLRAQHNEVQQELALHPEALAQAIHVEPITAAPRRVATSADMAAEINRMQRIITVLTAENMRLRGLL